MAALRLNDPQDLPKANAALARVIAKSVGTRADTLSEAARRARRHYPAKFSRDVELLLQSEQLLESPKLARQIDLNALRAAVRRIERQAGKIDLKTERERRVLGLVTTILLDLVLVLVGLFAFLVWRGFI